MKRTQVAAGIIEDDLGRVLIAQRPTGKKFSGYWEFPGGKIEAGESAPVALRRELKEELTLDVSVGRFLGIFPFDYDDHQIDLHVYLVRAINEPKRTEDIHVFKWVNPVQIRTNEMTPADLAPLRAYLDLSGLSTE